MSPRLPWHFTLPPVPALSPIQSVTESAPSTVHPEAAGAGVVEGGWSVDGTLLVIWGSCAGLLALYLMYAIGVLQGRRREWRRDSLDGVPVLVSRDIGPAVIGWRRLDIVVPEWVRDLEHSARALVLRHEMEHVIRQDPRLLMRTWLGLVAMPWNPALWWQLRRLRRAIELDCDARVVASGVDVSRYGSVLLEAVGRCSRGGLPAFAAFAERSADLEARINALTAARSGFWRGRALLAGAIATVLAAAACLLPDSLAPKPSTQAVRPAAAQPPSLEWVLANLRDFAPADLVILYRTPNGQFLGSETRVRTSPGGRLERRGPPAPAYLVGAREKDIESIEVLRGAKYLPPGIDGVIVITFKVGAEAGSAARIHLIHQLGQDQKRTAQLAMAAATRPAGADDWRTYIWFETDSAGAIREAGYVADKVAMIRRNGRRPAESGMWNSDGPNRKQVHWARYEVP